MKKPIFLSLITLILMACGGQNSNPTAESMVNEPLVEIDTIPRVTGIGGIFFKAGDPDGVKKWYSDNLGFSIDDYGSVFEFRNALRPDEINYLNWDPFSDTTSYFNPSNKDFMINYRVQNIEGLVEKLKKNGVTILDEIATYEYGKFVHIMDMEGNKIELWEPEDSVLSEFGRETNK